MAIKVTEQRVGDQYDQREYTIVHEYEEDDGTIMNTVLGFITILPDGSISINQSQDVRVSNSAVVVRDSQITLFDSTGQAFNCFLTGTDNMFNMETGTNAGWLPAKADPDILRRIILNESEKIEERA